MKTDECLARARRALLESAEKMKMLNEAESAAAELVRKSRVAIATARRTIAANPMWSDHVRRRRS